MRESVESVDPADGLLGSAVGPEAGSVAGIDEHSGGSAVLRAVGVEYHIRDKRIVGPVEMSVDSGEIVALVGPNGAGKSTLLGLLSGDIGDRRSVEVLGTAISDIAPRELARLRGVLPQDSSVSFPFRVHEVVAMGRAPWHGTVRHSTLSTNLGSGSRVGGRGSNHKGGLGRHTDRHTRSGAVRHARGDESIVLDAMVECDVAHLGDRTVTKLSGGEQARVALARLFAQRTPLLLLDEPTAALDIHHQEKVFNALAARRAEGAAVVVVIHDLSLAAAHADRVIVLQQGRIAAEGTPREALRPELLSHIYGHEINVLEHPQSATPIVVPAR
ncbi:MAG: heme ABC transporter ATP-binding protein [Microthrixaceae bacterium]